MNASSVSSSAELDPVLVSGLVVVLTLAVAFNLFLSLRLAKLVAALAFAGLPDSVPIGQPLPEFSARKIADGRRLSSDDVLSDQAAVLVFLSQDCEKCRQRIPEIQRILPLAEEAGVRLWIICAGRERLLRRYFAATGLLPRVLHVQTGILRRLNPRRAAPFYIFVDAQRAVQASSFIGDEDWLSFRSQIGDSGS